VAPYEPERPILVGDNELDQYNAVSTWAWTGVSTQCSSCCRRFDVPAFVVRQILQDLSAEMFKGISCADLGLPCGPSALGQSSSLRGLLKDPQGGDASPLDVMVPSSPL